MRASYRSEAMRRITSLAAKSTAISNATQHFARRRGWCEFNDMIDVSLLDGMGGPAQAEDATQLLRHVDGEPGKAV